MTKTNVGRRPAAQSPRWWLAGALAALAACQGEMATQPDAARADASHDGASPPGTDGATPGDDASSHPDTAVADDATSPPDGAPGSDGAPGLDGATGDDVPRLPDGAPCPDGARRCTASNAVEECQGGAYVVVSTCPFACAAGACTASVSCTPGQYRCSGNQVEICNSSGTAFLYAETCAVGCAAGLCTGACTPGARRCNGARAETCNATGTGWSLAMDCATFCEAGRCALPSLDVTTNTSLDGDVLVAGAVVVRSGVTLSAPSGALTIRAQSVTVESGASIVVAPTGDGTAGLGATGVYTGSGCYGYSGGGGGGNGTAGAPGDARGGCVRAPGGAVIGSAGTLPAWPGGRGGDSSLGTAGAIVRGGRGGGLLRVWASGAVNIAGQLTANGENAPPGGGYGGAGGGAGGTIVVAGDMVTVSGSVSAVGGAGGAAATGIRGGAGGNGWVFVLSGASRTVTGTLTGAAVQALAPPFVLASSTHPDPARYYNDDFGTAALAWSQSFPSRAGYYWTVDTSPLAVPTPVTGRLATTELVAVDRAALVAGDNYFHLVPVDARSAVGTVQNALRIRVNATPPTVTSTSHPSQTTWSSNPDVFYAWMAPNGDANYVGFYYVLDHYGTTVPTATSGTFLPITQQQLLRSGLANGVWGFHVVSVDTHGYLTRAAGHYVVRLGPDPGTGGVLGQVVSAAGGAPVSGATVAINRGLFPSQTTNATGNYNFMAVPVGTWEVTVSRDGFRAETRTVAITPGMSTPLNVMLTPM